MQTVGIEVHDVWKKFHRGELHDSLRDFIPAMAKRLVGGGIKRDELAEGDFWAVKAISFEVKPGQAMGIIGPNGAGKSTLLKILTRVLRPSRGECRIRGRTGALIEVAAGFHPDLTGRENVYLQGAIMGMRQTDIAGKFDEIVAFSGVSDFIDTPVKRYSSGMNARLGFSIAAHLDPEVLIIDEVLSVGDMAFQQRAFGRLATLIRSGIPVVVVSHQLDRVATLCTDAILLRRGEVAYAGKPTECVSAYMRSQPATVIDAGSTHPLRLESLEVVPPQPVRSGGPVRLRIAGQASGFDQQDHAVIGLRVRGIQTGQVVFVTKTGEFGITLPSNGPFELGLEIEANLPEGAYSIETYVWDLRRGKEAALGPSAVLEVTPGAPFWGAVQMNTRLNLVDPITNGRVQSIP